MFTVHYMSTKVHDNREINNHEAREIKFGLTKVGESLDRENLAGLGAWESRRHGMHTVKIEVVL